MAAKVTPPKWFQEWLVNDFFHLKRDLWWVKWLTLAILAAIIMAVVTELI